MDNYERLCEVNNQISEFEDSEDFYDGDGNYQYLLERKSEIQSDYDRECKEYLEERGLT